MKYQLLSVIIPVHNESKTLKRVLDSVVASPICGLNRQIILIDDGSDEDTKKIISEIKHLDIQIYTHEVNEGKGSAIQTGLKHVKGDIVLIQDADLEYNPSDIEKLLKPIISGKAQVVYGSRYLTKNTLDFWHSFLNKAFSKISGLVTGQKLTDIMTGYKVITREVMEQIKGDLHSKGFSIETEITIKISRLGYRIYEVPISYSPRSSIDGKHMNFTKATGVFFDLVKHSLFD